MLESVSPNSRHQTCLGKALLSCYINAAETSCDHQDKTRFFQSIVLRGGLKDSCRQGYSEIT